MTNGAAAAARTNNRAKDDVRPPSRGADISRDLANHDQKPQEVSARTSRLMNVRRTRYCTLWLVLVLTSALVRWWRRAVGERADTPTPIATVLLAAGDVGVCGAVAPVETGQMLDAMEGTIVALGDLAYRHGTAQEFATCYDPVWGRHKARTRPSPGNHEYETSGALPVLRLLRRAGRSVRAGVLQLPVRGLARAVIEQQPADRRGHRAGAVDSQRADREHGALRARVSSTIRSIAPGRTATTRGWPGCGRCSTSRAWM